ncbi:unnamed protein product [Caenorhabditis brenneri]
MISKPIFLLLAVLVTLVVCDDSDDPKYFIKQREQLLAAGLKPQYADQLITFMKKMKAAYSAKKSMEEFRKTDYKTLKAELGSIYNSFGPEQKRIAMDAMMGKTKNHA